MPGLYNITSNANITVGDTIGLYQQSGGNVYILNNAQQLLNTLSQNGNVNFALDPASSNTRVLAYTANIGTAAGTYGSNITIPIITVGADGRVTSITTANVTVGSTYSNTNVAAYLTTATIATTGNVSAGNLISANFLYPNGVSILTGIGGTYSNANVAAYLATNTDPTISSLNANAAVQAVQIDTLNANLGAFETYANITFTTYSNANVAAYLLTNTGDIQAGNVVVQGTLLSDDITASNVLVDGDTTITGNLLVLGNTTTFNSNTITTNDKNITVANNISIAAFLDGAGLDVGNTSIATWRYNFATSSWQSNIAITPASNAISNLGGTANYWNDVYAVKLYGDGSSLTNLPVQTGTYSNTNVAAYLASNTDPTISNLNANAAVQQLQIDSLNANVTAANINIQTINANVGAYQTYANANIGTLYLGNISTNANLGAYQTYANANAAVQQLQIDSLNANVGAYQTYANANIGTLYLGNISTNANLGAYQTYANANIGTLFNGNISTNANLGAYQTYANANIGTLFNGNISTNANLGAFQTYANANFITSGGTYGNANVSAFLPTYAGNIGNTSINSGPRYIYSGNVVQISANSGAGAVDASIQLFTGNNTIPVGSQTDTGQIYISSKYVSIRGPNVASSGGAGIRLTGNTVFLGETTANGNLVNMLQANTLISSQGTSFQGRTNYGGYLFVTNTITAGSSIVSSGNITAGNNLITTGGVFWSNGTAYSTVSGAYGNTQVAAYLASNSAITITTTANVQTTANVIAGNIFIPQTIAGLGFPFNWLVLGASQSTAVGGFGVNADDTTVTAASWTGAFAITANGNKDWIFDIAGNLVLPGNVGQTYITYQDGSVYGGSGGSQTPWTSNIAGAGFYLTNAILETTRQKVITLGNLTGTVSINANNGPIQSGTLTGNITLNTNNFTNLNAGQTVTLILTQDATGSRLLTSNLKYAANNRALSTAANSIDSMSVLYDGTNYLASLVKGYA